MVPTVILTVIGLVALNRLTQLSAKSVSYVRGHLDD